MDNVPITCSGQPILKRSLITSIKVSVVATTGILNWNPLGDLHLCHLQWKWIHPCQLLASCWGHTHPLSDCKEQEVARLSGFNTFFPIWSGLALRAPPRTWWSWGWRTTIGTPTKTAPSFGTLKMENWLRFRRRLTIRRQVIVAQVGKIVRCTCGGYLRRDLDWPPPKIHVRREQKKTLTRPKILPKNTACPLLEERESRREEQVITRIKISKCWW